MWWRRLTQGVATRSAPQTFFPPIPLCPDRGERLRPLIPTRSRNSGLLSVFLRNNFCLNFLKFHDFHWALGPGAVFWKRALGTWGFGALFVFFPLIPIPPSTSCWWPGYWGNPRQELESGTGGIGVKDYCFPPTWQPPQDRHFRRIWGGNYRYHLPIEMFIIQDHSSTITQKLTYSSPSLR